MSSYTVDYFCDNCGYKGPVEFLYGQVAPYLTFCPRCGLEQANKLGFEENRTYIPSAEEKPETD